MKKIQVTITAVFTAAVLFSCGGNTQNNQSDSSAHHHSHDSMPVAAKPDTATISEGQSVFFDKGLAAGAVVNSPLTVFFGIQGMRVLPADSGVVANAGHHHLLVDTLGSIPAGSMVPMGSSKILHFGKAQMQSKPLVLKPGKHTLTLQFANGNHISYGVRMSKTIEITVK